MTITLGKPSRTAFGETLAELADDDPRILVLDGDMASSTGAQIFEAAHPERFLQMGIAEQNMLAAAAGLAATGFVPVVTSFAAFVAGRAFDSIRVVIAQPGLNVKVVGAYAGLLTGKTGKTHQIFNDVALMRTLSGVVVLAPGDEEETRQATKAMLELNGPVYMQTTRDPSPALFDSDYHFEIGRAVVLREGTDVTLVSTGPQSARAREAAEILSRQGVSAAVLHLPTIKPIDEDALVRAAQTTGLVVVVEEQNVLGGLGGAVAEVLSDRCPVPVKRLGILDTYGESGSNDVLLDKYRLSAAAVASDVLSIVDTSRELAVAGQQ